MPLPTGQVKEIYAQINATDNFFETYDEFFGTLFTPIKLKDGTNLTDKNGVPKL
jgi:hypothetical protein